MNEHLSQSYEYYDADNATKWQLLPKADLATHAVKLAMLSSYLNGIYRPSITNNVQPTEQEIEVAEGAKEFVENALNIEVNCEIGITSQLGEENSSGEYDPFLHALFVNRRKTQTEYGDTITLGSTFVHEMVHSTSIKTSRIIEINKGSNSDMHVLMPHHVTDISLGVTQDNFFEEGLAEEIASRWREQFDPKLAERNRDLKNFTNPRLPARMYKALRTIDEISDDFRPAYAFAAISAYGIQILSEYTGVDIINLLIKARKPETRAEASDLLKKTVDSIEPGLYDLLTSARYSLEDFEDCLSIIKDAIANHAHSQIK